MLFLVALALVGYCELGHQRFLAYQHDLAAKTGEGAARLIGLFIDNVKRSVALFVRDQGPLIGALASNADDEPAYERLRSLIRSHFPRAFTFVIAGGDGEVLVDDFDGRLDELCRTDIHRFAQLSQAQDIVIHPNPLGYHFDVMVRWVAADGREGVFFVSFRPDVISRMLAESELSGHEMMLINRDVPGLIEVTDTGSRDRMGRGFVLSAAEQARTSFRRSIPGTRWELVDIPSAGLFAAHANRVRIQALVVFLAFLSATLYMAYLVRREERARNLAEQALLDSHRRLEARVQQRTRALSALNRTLELEMSERQRAQEALSASEERYALAIEGSRDAIWDWDLEADKIYFSPRFGEMLGEPGPPGMDAQAWFARLPAEERGLLEAALDSITGGERGQFTLEFRLRHADQGYRWFLMRGVVVRDKKGRACRMAGSLTDITDLKRSQQQLLHDAFHDALTGLPNRALFMDRLGQAVRASMRRSDHRFAVLFLDLDGFKRVNDSLGHSCGDALLKAVTERLTELIRHEDTLARLSGDEFAILLEGVDDVGDATLFCERILACLDEPFVLDNHSVYVGVSIGISLSTAEDTDPQDLLRDADVAMYHAKSKGKGRYEIFDEHVRKGIVERLRLETDLRHAIEHRDFRVLYQPIVAVDGGQLIGFEALVRWQRGVHGLMEPAQFISIAEDANLIASIGDIVLRTACRQLAEWRRRLPGAADLSMGVNLSCKQFLQADLLERIQGALSEDHIGGLDLTLEITETAIMHNISCAQGTLQQLKALGVTLSVDDFGTGYSSLSYLHAMPLDVLKIDRSFVSRMHVDKDSLEIVKTVINLGRNLGLKVIAEGVENDVQLAALREMRCHYAQGFLFSGPVRAEEARRLIEAA